MGDKIDKRIEEFKKNEEQKKKKKIIKRILIFILIILLIVALYITTETVRKINLSKLTDEKCEYNGEHPIETGMKETTHSMCRGCSDIISKIKYKSR